MREVYNLKTNQNTSLGCKQYYRFFKEKIDFLNESLYYNKLKEKYYNDLNF